MTVSALVTNYNKLETISLVLDALVSCTEIDSIFVYDDCSTDGSLELLKLYEARKQINLTRGRVNIGVSAARNRLNEIAINSEVYVYVDGDDIILPKAKAQQITEFRDDAKLVFSYSDYLREHKDQTKYVCSGDFKFERLTHYNFIPFSSVMSKLPLVFEPIHHEDYLCWLTHLKNIRPNQVHYFSRETFIYSDDQKGLSKNPMKGFFGNLRVKLKFGIKWNRIFFGTFLYMKQALSKRFVQ